MKKIMKSEKFLYIIITVAFISTFLAVQLKTQQKLDALREVVPVVIHDVTFEEEKENERNVYVTPSGKKYHLDGCKFLNEKRMSISLKDAAKAGYESCKYCQP